MGGAHDVLSVACLPFHHAGVCCGPALGPIGRCLPPESNGTVGLFRPAFRPRKLDRHGRAERSRRGVRGEWHGERMTTSPGSRVSCETALRPPATARVAAVLRVLRTVSHTRAIGCQRAGAGNANRPTRLVRRWGDLVVPVGARVDLCRRPWVLHSRLRAAPRLRVPLIVTSARGRDGLPAIPPHKPGFDAALRVRAPW